MIYFGYGIHHSAEATAAHSSETEMTGFSHKDKSEDMSPEKEAFLLYAIDDRDDEDRSL